MEKILMIVGMHRSGTSLVTQWLHRCGMNVGSKLLAAGLGNKEGHYEDEEFLNLHLGWLRKQNQPDNGFISQPPAPLNSDDRQQLKTLILKKRSQQVQWGWKEPRTCLWLPAYREALPDAFSLVVMRSFNDTVNSMLMREYRFQNGEHDKIVKRKKGLSKLKWNYLKRKKPSYYFELHAESYLKTWIYYYEQIIAHCQALPPDKLLLVNYEHLLTDDDYVVNKLSKQWGFSLHFVPFKSIFKKELLSKTKTIDGFIKDKSLLAKAHQLEQDCRALSLSQRNH